MANEAKKVEEPKEIKFTDEELESLQGLQTSYQEKQSVLGQLAVQKILLNQQIDALNNRTSEVEQEYQTTQQEERDLVKTLNDKYGPGQLDPATGVFTPSN
jgi:phosphopantetheine adenylyltransferase|tara:strand:- start:478 stop:780 length:303 start_codon:yes stop_codon:yes gene_type:complete